MDVLEATEKIVSGMIVTGIFAKREPGEIRDFAVGLCAGLRDASGPKSRPRPKPSQKGAQPAKTEDSW